jgi:hypothetical protein
MTNYKTVDRFGYLIDDFKREVLAIEIDLSLPSTRVIRALKK